MAFTYNGEIGTAEEKASPADNSLSMTVTSNVSAGTLVIVRCVTDNGTASEGASTRHSITDSAGNSYTRMVEYTRTDGSSGDGVTTSLH